MFAKKKALGFKAKQRTKADVDKDYTFHAIHYGHKSRVIAQLQNELDEHLANLTALNEEGMKLPPDAPTAPEEKKEA